MFIPSVKNCAERGCEHLVWQEWYGRRRKVCSKVGNRIPGNIKCPLEKEA